MPQAWSQLGVHGRCQLHRQHADAADECRQSHPGLLLRAARQSPFMADVSRGRGHSSSCSRKPTGSARLVGLVNNAGVVDMTCRVEDMSFERLSTVCSQSTSSVRFCAHVKRSSACRPRHGGDGGSHRQSGDPLASKLGSPSLYVDYAASKGAIDTMTVGLALEVADEGIRVNAVRPGA